jgi:methyl-accepting chemotaxis protein/ribose transport system substrate-binding protein
MKGIYQEINEIGNFTAETKEKGMELQAASDEISSSTQDVAAVTEEVLAGLEGITSQAYSLNTMLSNIQSLVKRFNTSVLPVDKNSSNTVKIACLSLINNEFWDAIQRGAIYAQKELAQKNAVVDFFGFDPNGGTPIGEWFVSKMRECINNGYHGFSLPGFLPDTIPVVEEAAKKNVLVMAFNCDFAEKTSRMAIFGPDNYEGGKLAGNLISDAIEKTGDIVIIRGSSEVAENRKKGILDSVKRFKKIRVVDDIAINDNANSVYEAVREYVQKNSNIQGICIAGGGVEGGAKALEELGYAEKIKLVGFEHTKEIYQYIKKGIIYASVGQDTFGQGHDPLIWLYNCIVTGEKTPNEIMYLRSDVVDSRNIDDLLIV